MPKVIMLLSNPFRPDVRVFKEAKSLVQKGYDVVVDAWDRSLTYPECEMVDGIRIKRTRIRAPYDDFSSLIVKFPLFWLSTFFRNIKEEFDIVHVHDFDTLLPGVFLSKMRKKPLIYDAHEIYSSIIKESTPEAVPRLVESVEKFLLKKADGMIVITDHYASHFKALGAQNVEVVMNCSDMPSISEQDVKSLRRSLGAENRFLLVYIGTLGPERMLEELALGFANLKSDDFLFIVGGYGVLERRIREISANSHNLKFIGEVPVTETPKYNAAADSLIISGDSSLLAAKMAIPNKVFEAMALGKPILVSKDTAAEKIVEQVKCGLAVEYGNFESVLKALERLKNDNELRRTFGMNGIKAVKEEFNWQKMELRLLRFYSEIFKKYNGKKKK